MADARVARTDGYALASIVSHWLGAVLVVALFFTHEAQPGSAAFAFHVSGGAIVGLSSCGACGTGSGVAAPMHRTRRPSSISWQRQCTGRYSSSSWSWSFPGICCPGRWGGPGYLRSAHSVSHGCPSRVPRVHGAGARRLGAPVHPAPRTSRRRSHQARNIRAARCRSSNVQGGIGRPVGNGLPLRPDPVLARDRRALRMRRRCTDRRNEAPHCGRAGRIKTSRLSHQGTSWNPLAGAGLSTSQEREHEAATHSENRHLTRRRDRRRRWNRGSPSVLSRNSMLVTTRMER